MDFIQGRFNKMNWSLLFMLLMMVRLIANEQSEDSFLKLNLFLVITLSYTQATSSSGFSLSDTASIR